jgi:hypothetical protein
VLYDGVPSSLRFDATQVVDNFVAPLVLPGIALLIMLFATGEETAFCFLVFWIEPTVLLDTPGVTRSTMRTYTLPLSDLEPGLPLGETVLDRIVYRFLDPTGALLITPPRYGLA